VVDEVQVVVDVVELVVGEPILRTVARQVDDSDFVLSSAVGLTRRCIWNTRRAIVNVNGGNARALAVMRGVAA
jgi:hypothetical protein